MECRSGRTCNQSASWSLSAAVHTGLNRGLDFRSRVEAGARHSSRTIIASKVPLVAGRSARGSRIVPRGPSRGAPAFGQVSRTRQPISAASARCWCSLSASAFTRLRKGRRAVLTSPPRPREEPRALERDARFGERRREPAPRRVPADVAPHAHSGVADGVLLAHAPERGSAGSGCSTRTLSGYASRVAALRRCSA
jgi:hypothetical protein